MCCIFNILAAGVDEVVGAVAEAVGAAADAEGEEAEVADEEVLEVVAVAVADAEAFVVDVAAAEGVAEGLLVVEGDVLLAGPAAAGVAVGEGEP